MILVLEFGLSKTWPTSVLCCVGKVFAAPENVSQTKMDVNNLSTVMAPSCLRSCHTSPETLLENTQHEMSFIRTLIENLDTTDMEAVIWLGFSQLVLKSNLTLTLTLGPNPGNQILTNPCPNVDWHQLIVLQPMNKQQEYCGHFVATFWLLFFVCRISLIIAAPFCVLSLPKWRFLWMTVEFKVSCWLILLSRAPFAMTILLWCFQVLFDGLRKL